jgi:hypothetical protein
MTLDKDTLTGIGVILTFLVGLLSLFISIKNTKKVQFINTVTASRIKWMDKLRNYISEFTALISNSRDDYGIETIWNDEGLTKVMELDLKLNLLLNKDGDEDIKILDKIKEIKLNYTELTKLYKYRDLKYDRQYEYHSKISNDFSKGTINNIIETYKKSKIEDSAIRKFLLENYKSEDVQNSIYECIKLYKDKNIELTKELTKISQEYLKKEWERVKKESKNGDLSDSIEDIKDNKLIKPIDIKHFSDLRKTKIYKYYYNLHLIIKLFIMGTPLIIIVLLILKYHNII